MKRLPEVIYESNASDEEIQEEEDAEKEFLKAVFKEAIQEWISEKRNLKEVQKFIAHQESAHK